MSLRRWDLAWASLNPTQGYEQAGRRVYLTEVLLKADTAGLVAASLVLCHQLRTVSAARLSSTLARLGDPAKQVAVERAVRLWLDLHVPTTDA